MIIKIILAIIVLTSVIYRPINTQAAFFNDKEARQAILHLQNKISVMEKDVSKKVEQNSILNLASLNDQLHQEITKLRGQIELINNQIIDIEQSQKDIYIKLNNVLYKNKLQKSNTDVNESKIYNQALNLFQQGNYKTSILAFTNFLHKYPKSDFKVVAQYWLGNALYAEGNYQKAIIAQQVIVRHFPTHPKIADALLSIANSYIQLQNKLAAKKTLKSLIGKYPESHAAKIGQKYLNTLNLT